MKQHLKSLQKILGKNIISAYEYPKYPHTTLVCIVESNAFEAVQKSKAVLDEIPFICLSKDEVLNAGDVFSLQYFAIQKTSKLIFGDDIFSEIEISKSDLRRKIEYDIRNKNIYLRQEALRQDPKKLIPHIIPELLPVLIGISFLHDTLETDIQKLLLSKTFAHIDLTPLQKINSCQVDCTFSNQESLDILGEISVMLEQWAEVMDKE